jgi:hypothetical protein
MSWGHDRLGDEESIKENIANNTMQVRPSGLLLGHKVNNRYDDKLVSCSMVQTQRECQGCARMEEQC